MGKVCAVVSVKGGTGKTTTCVNTGFALAKEGFRTLLVDANLEGSNLSFHLGLSTHDIVTVHDVVRGDCSPLEAIYTHPSGVNLMLGSVNLDDMDLRDADLKKVIDLVKPEFDFVIVDCSSGLSGSVRSVINNADEVLIVTNPELPAVVDAFKIVQYCEKTKSFIRGVVINKSNKHDDLLSHDVEAILGRPVISVVPEDRQVRKAMKDRTPMVSYKPKRLSAKQLKNVAYIVGELERKEAITIWDKILKRLNKTY